VSINDEEIAEWVIEGDGKTKDPVSDPGIEYFREAPWSLERRISFGSALRIILRFASMYRSAFVHFSSVFPAILTLTIWWLFPIVSF